MRKKCIPQKQPKRYDRPPVCTCPKILNPKKLFHDNTHDIAKTLVEVLILSGIHRCKATGAKDILLDAFKYYDNKRHGETNETEANNVTKETVILSLGTKCMMSCVEAQFTYSVMKQLLKAFFYSVPECGIRNYIMESQSIYNQQGAWEHVARRTAQIFGAYGYVLCPTVKDYNAAMKRIFQGLFHRMKKRVDPIEIPEYNCRESTKRVIKRAERPQELKENADSNVQKTTSSCTLLPKPCVLSCFNEFFTVEDNKKIKDCKPVKRPVHVPKNTDYPFDKLPRCPKCYFPKDLCNCNVDPETGKLFTKSSQGPFKCEWYRMDKPRCVKSHDHICPVDCWDHCSTFSGSECICEEESEDDYTDVSECDLETSDSEFEDFTDDICEEICSEETDTDVEPFMIGKDYHCHVPLCIPDAIQEKPYIPEPAEVIVNILIDKHKQKPPSAPHKPKELVKKPPKVISDKPPMPGTEFIPPPLPPKKTMDTFGKPPLQQEPIEPETPLDSRNKPPVVSKPEKPTEKSPDGPKPATKESEPKKPETPSKKIEESKKEEPVPKLDDQGRKVVEKEPEKPKEVVGEPRIKEGKPDTQKPDTTVGEKGPSIDKQIDKQPESEKLPPKQPEESGEKKPDKEKPVDEKSLKEQPVDEKPVQEKPGEGKPIEEKPGKEKPGEEKSIKEKPIEEKPVKEKQIDEKPGGEKQVGDIPTQEKPPGEKPLEEKPLKDKPVEEKPGNEKPVEEKPDKDKPGKEKPGEEKPGEEKPGEGTPGDEKPGKEKPIGGKPSKETPTKEKSDKEKPIKDKFQKPGMEKPETEGIPYGPEQEKVPRKPSIRPPKGSSGSSKKKRLPCCKCVPKKTTSKPKICQKCAKLIIIQKNRLVPATSFC